MVTPSSQPGVCCQWPGPRKLCRVWRESITLDDIADANGCDEITAANGGVESDERRSQQVPGMWLLRGGGVEEETGGFGELQESM